MKIIFFTAFVFLFASCERDMKFDTISVTEPTLTVIVETKTVNGTEITYTKVNGAEVRLYNNETDFENNGTPLSIKATGQDGKAVFTKTELVQKGIFYAKAVSDTLEGTGITPYLLLNDGETYLRIELN